MLRAKPLIENKIGCLNETLSPHRLWQLWEKNTKPKQCWLEMHKIFYYSVFFNVIRFFGQMTYYCKLHYIHRTAIAVLAWEKQRGKMLKWCFHHFLFVIRKTKLILQKYVPTNVKSEPTPLESCINTALHGTNPRLTQNPENVLKHQPRPPAVAENHCILTKVAFFLPNDV